MHAVQNFEGAFAIFCPPGYLEDLQPSAIKLERFKKLKNQSISACIATEPSSFTHTQQVHLG